MKRLIGIGSILVVLLHFSCASKSGFAQNTAQNDTIRIANDSLEYEVIIIDAGFTSFLSSVAKPRKYYSQSYLESRNIPWVMEYNRRVRTPSINRDQYVMEIDYRSGINYGYEVNYLLYNYLLYFQRSNNQRLGTFQPNI